eukprot:m.230186 g.230186  ORF g.230186 m.230186 type:complete len:50 (+) comp54266_c0_seq2:376-525(+)
MVQISVAISQELTLAKKHSNRGPEEAFETAGVIGQVFLEHTSTRFTPKK